MENYQRIVVIGAGLEQVVSSGPPYHLFMETVLLDQTHGAQRHPLLFQVSQHPISEAMISTSIEQYLSMQRDAFILLGAVMEIDRKARMIHLMDGHTLSYKYLITVSGNSPVLDRFDQAREFAPGVQTLVDALKIHEGLMNHLHRQPLKQSGQSGHGFVNISHPSSPIAQLASGTLASKHQKQNSSRIQRLYQVQI